MIDELKVLVLFLCHLGTGSAQAEQDGKITLSDAWYFLPALKDISGVLDGLSKVPQEAWALTQEQADEIAKEIEDNLKIESAKAKLMIEEAVKAIPHLLGIYNAVKL